MKTFLLPLFGFAIALTISACGGISIEKYEDALTGKSRCETELASLKSSSGSCAGDLQRCQQEASSRGSAACADDTPKCTMALIGGFLDNMGVRYQTIREDTIKVTDRTGSRKPFNVFIRYFENVEVVYVVADDYITLPNVIGTDDDMTKACLLLSKAMDVNYQLTIGKLEFNTKNGALKYSVVLNTDNGLGYETFKATYQSLVSSADKQYGELADFMRENGYPID